METNPRPREQPASPARYPLPPSPASRAAQREQLARINTNDFLEAFGLATWRRGRTALAWACRRPALRLAQQVLTCDDLVSAAGLQAGGTWMLGQYVRRFVVENASAVPHAGPVLFVANHPGLYDTLALFASIARPDLRVIAADRPFLRALPAVHSRLINVAEDASGRMRVVREATRHMRAGGALLTFPGGQIEPDPAVLPGAVDSLHTWSTSLELLIRLVPDVAVVPTIVSGVLSPNITNHPLTYLWRNETARQRFVATLHVLFPALHRNTVRVTFGEPLRWTDAAISPAARAAVVLAAAERMLRRYER